MVPFPVIMAAVLCQDPRQRTFPQQNHFGQALLLYRADPALRERIQVRAFGRQLNRLHATACQRRPKRRTKPRVALVQHVTAGMMIAPSLLRRAASDLLHPFLVRMPGDAGYVHPSTLQVQKKQYIIGHQPAPTEHFHGEEIAPS